MAKQTRFDRRRNVLRGLAITVASGAILPNTWVQPTVESALDLIVSPAHAQKTAASSKSSKGKAASSSMQSSTKRSGDSARSTSGQRLHIQIPGSDFNASKGANNQKPKP